VWQVCSKDYTYIKVKVLSIPIRNIYMTAHFPDLMKLYFRQMTNNPISFVSEKAFDNVPKLTSL
jgi:hypothetical protein